MSTKVEQQDIVVNGEERQVPVGCTLVGLLKKLNIDQYASKGIAVAVNEEVVRKEAWKDQVLSDGDEVEIITAKQGG